MLMIMTMGVGVGWGTYTQWLHPHIGIREEMLAHR